MQPENTYRKKQDTAEAVQTSSEIIKLEAQIKEAYHDCPGGMCYFRFDTADPRVERNDAGLARGYYLKNRIFPKAVCTLEGRLYKGAFIVTRMTPDMKRRTELIDLLSESISGIAKARAGIIYDTVSANMDRDRDEVLQIVCKKLPSVRPSIIAKALDFFCIEDVDLAALERLLLRYGVPEDVILKIFDHLGAGAAEKLQKNPYLGIQDGLQLWVSELLAKNSGMDMFDMRRISGLVHFVMRRSVKCGYTMCPWQMFYDAIDYYSGRYAFHIYDVPEIFTVNSACNDKAFCWDEEGLSYRSLYGIEKKIGEEASILQNNPHETVVTETGIEATERHVGVKYSQSQKDAFSLIKRSGVSILTGGPGTGKTTVARGLIERFKASNKDAKVALCAPTGRAAKRLSEATGMPAQTIHKLIDYRPYGEEESLHKTKFDPIDADLIVMDEGSMVDTKLFYLFLQAVRPGTTVIVSGDEDQLPSVGPGNVLHDLISSGSFAYCRLTENFRQEDDGSIIENAGRILHGKEPVKRRDFHLIRCESEEKAYEAVMTVSKHFYDKEHPYALQILGPSYKGDAGVDAVNKGMREYLDMNMEKKVSLGDKVMFTHTDYKHGYVNGQMGVITYFDDREFVVDSDGGSLDLPRSCLEDVVPAYSITIHKAQGSEADRVVICLPEDPGIMLQRSLLYTAVTRAKKEVWIIYVRGALQKALSHNSCRYRPTRLGGILSQAAGAAG